MIFNIPIYHIPDDIPESMAKRLESRQCIYSWGDSEGNRWYHLVAGDKVKNPIQLGGLGLKSLVEVNRGQ